MITRFKKTPRGEWLYHLKFKNVSTSAKRVRPFQQFKKQFGQDVFFKKLSFPQTVLGLTGAALFGIVTNPHIIMTVFGKLINYFEDAADPRGNIYLRNVRENIKEKGRKNSIGIGVGQGLAWLHYADYLRHVLPDMKDKIEQSKWYNELSDEEKKRMPMKLYELIPRKCYVDITGIDDNIQHEAEIIMDREKAVKVQIYSIMDGHSKYYCMCNCPNELKTMNTVNDIQMAGISRSKYSFDFPWNRKSTVQLFTVDTKLVQLMKFYYTLHSFLCTENTRNLDRARLLLFNESEKKLSTVLLQEIKEDLKDDTPLQEPNGLILKSKRLAEKCNDDIGNCTEQITSDKDYLESDNKASNSLSQSKKKNSKVKTHSSLMEKNLLTAEEKKDVVYEFDVFVTCGKDVYDEKTNEPVSDKSVEAVNETLIAENMKVLLEKDCIGKDWLIKLKYAATKCRWIVILDSIDHNTKDLIEIKLNKVLSFWIIPFGFYCIYKYFFFVPKLVASHQVTDSLKRILESRKVQTVAIVKKQNELHVLDDLKCVICIPLKHVIRNLYPVISGSETKLDRSQKVCFIPGDLAVGLAWTYAVNRLRVILPGAIEANDGIMRPLRQQEKTVIVLPSGNCFDIWNDFQARKENMNLQENIDGLFKVEYPRLLELLLQRNTEYGLSQNQIHLEVEIFYKSVNKIMEILLPEKTEYYEFLFHDETKTTLKEALQTRFFEEKFLLNQKCIDNSPF